MNLRVALHVCDYHCTTFGIDKAVSDGAPVFRGCKVNLGLWDLTMKIDNNIAKMKLEF